MPDAPCPTEVDPIRGEADRLVAWMGQWERVVVAFSGGVDSSVVAAAAKRGAKSALAVTADSASVPRWQAELAARIAGEIGIEHRFVPTGEVENRSYRRNDSDRCFHCKATLYETLDTIAQRFAETAVIVSGTNADDLGDHRPGIEAGRRAAVLTPLADLGWDKAMVRSVAGSFGLSNEGLPASPCLASRIAYGVEVTTERLNRVEQAEAWLRERGFSPLRVRLHADELARIEVPRPELSRLIDLDQQGNLGRAFRELGFRYVTVDLQGLQSGSLNRVITLGQVASRPFPGSSVVKGRGN